MGAIERAHRLDYRVNYSAERLYMIGMIKIPSQMPGLPMPVLKGVFKKVGDKVQMGDVLFAYESDGAIFEETSVLIGTVIASFFKIGDCVSEGTPVLVVQACE